MYFTTCIGIEDNHKFSYIVSSTDFSSKSYFLFNNLDLIFLSVMCKSKTKLLLIYYYILYWVLFFCGLVFKKSRISFYTVFIHLVHLIHFISLYHSA